MPITALYNHPFTNQLLSYDVTIFGNLIYHLFRELSVEDYLKKGYKIQAYAPLASKNFLERSFFDGMLERKKVVTRGTAGCPNSSFCNMNYTIQYENKEVKIVVYYLFGSETFRDNVWFLHDTLSCSRNRLFLRNVPDIMDACPNPLGRVSTMDDYYLCSNPLHSNDIIDTLNYVYSENIPNFHTRKTSEHKFTSKCSICLTPNKKGESIKISCAHSYHVNCFRKLILSSLDKAENPTCPLCRQHILIGEF